MPYEGKQTVVLSTERGTEATVTQEVHTGPGKSRIEYLMPKRAAGRLVVMDGAWRWEYDSKGRVAVKSATSRQTASSSAAAATLSRVTRSYRITVDPKPVTVNNRTALVLRLDPKAKDRPRRVWWVDKATAFVLRREVYEVDGTLDQTTSFQSINLRPKVDPTVVKFVPAAGVKIVQRTVQQATATLADARKKLPKWARLKASVGNGFEFESARRVRVNSTHGVQVQYSDGLLGISLFQMPGKVAFPDGGHTVQEVRVGATPAKLVQLVAPYRILAWRDDGITFNLVADLTSSTMLHIARSVK